MLVNEININKDVKMYKEKLHTYNNQYDVLLDEQEKYWSYLENETISQEEFDYYIDLYDQNSTNIHILEDKIGILEKAIDQLKDIVEILAIVEVEIEGV